MAAQMCKADVGSVKFLRGRLDFLCQLLVSAGVLCEGSGDGLSVPDKDERSKQQEQHHLAVVGMQVTTEKLAENQALLKDDICGVKAVVEEVKSEAVHAATVSADAKSAAGEVADQCARVESACRKATTQCSNVFAEGIGDERQRIETNSTRIFCLANEVELLGRRRCNIHEPMAGQLSTTTETGEVFAEEIARPRQEERNEEFSKPSVEQTTTESTPRGSEEAPSPSDADQADSPVSDRDVGGISFFGVSHAPCRPGILDSSMREDQTTRAVAVLATSHGEQVLRPSARRRSIISDQRTRQPKEVGTQQALYPVRPRAARPPAQRATPKSWARASWPSLTGEAVGEDTYHNTRDEARTEVSLCLTRKWSMPHLTQSTLSGEEPQQGAVKRSGGLRETSTRRSTPAANGCHDACAPSSNSSPDYPRGRGSENETSNRRLRDGELQSATGSSSPGGCVLVSGVESQPSHEPPRRRPSTSTEMNPVGEGLLPYSTSIHQGTLITGQNHVRGKLGVSQRTANGKLVRVNTAASGTENAKLNPAELSARGMTGSRGIQLAFLEGAPTMWCPRDTWAPAAALMAKGDEANSSGGGGEEETSTSGSISLLSSKGDESERDYDRAGYFEVEDGGSPAQHKNERY